MSNAHTTRATARKQLKSSSSASGSESVRVMCRFRPENAQEQELNAPLAVRFDEHSDRFVNHTTHHNNREHRFKFDKVTLLFVYYLCACVCVCLWVRVLVLAITARPSETCM